MPGAGDEGAQGAQQRGHHGVCRAERAHEERGYAGDHSGVAHDLCAGQNAKHGDDGLAHLLAGVAEDLEHLGRGALLDDAAHNAAEHDEHAGVLIQVKVSVAVGSPA